MALRDKEKKYERSWDRENGMRKSIISLIGIPEEEIQKNGGGEILNMKMTANSPDLMTIF